MDKKTKIFLTLIADFALVGILCFSVYKMVTDAGTSAKNAYSWIIVLVIPVMFFISYMTFAGDKYEYKEGMFDEEDEDLESKEESEGPQSDIQKENVD